MRVNHQRKQALLHRRQNAQWPPVELEIASECNSHGPLNSGDHERARLQSTDLQQHCSPVFDVTSAYHFHWHDAARFNATLGQCSATWRAKWGRGVAGSAKRIPCREAASVWRVAPSPARSAFRGRPTGDFPRVPRGPAVSAVDCIRGNTHFPFADLNNVQIADLMAGFLARKGLD